MITFIHTADIHFGVENYGRIDPETGIHTRLLDFRDAFAQCVDAAIEKDVDFFLFSGDAYKTAHPTPTQQKLLLEQFLRLHAAKIPVIIIVGNHDHPLSFGKAHALDVFGNLPLDGFDVVSKPRIVRITTKSGPVQIVGIPWPARHNLVAKDEHRSKKATEITRYLACKVSQIITHLAEQLDPSIVSVLAGHLTVISGVFSGSEKTAVFGTDPTLLPSQLAIEPFDYVALGHLHRFQSLNKNGYPPVVYAGSTERVDFGERKEEKGYCSVSVDIRSGTEKVEPTFSASEGRVSLLVTLGGAPHVKVCSYQFNQLTTRPMIQFDIILTTGRDQTEQIIEQIEKKDIKRALIKIVYHVPEGKKDSVDLSAVQRACSDAHYIAGIVPVHTPVVRQRRADIQSSMSFADMLDSYFQSKELDVDDAQRLKDKAMKLYDEVTQHD